jgi:monoamine oxidase
MAVYDCIIIGAGYAGLSAAMALKEANKTFLVLEARDRVGGRVFTQSHHDGTYVDLGGSYLGVDQPRMYALAKQFGVETFDASQPGHTVLVYRGKRRLYSGLTPPLAFWELIDMHLLLRRFEKIAKTVNVEEPWKTTNAEQLDNITLASWINENCWTRAARDSMTLAAETIWGARTSEFSALHAFFYTKAGVSLTTLVTSRKGAQDQLIKGGAQTIANKIYAYLGEDCVHIDEPVTRIDQNRGETADSVVMVTTSMATYKARHIVVTIPPSQVLQIRFSPPLTHQHRILREHMPMGSYWKYIACYKKAFWREQGFSGEATSPDCLISVVFDASPQGTEYAVLMSFVVGQNARMLSAQSKAEREKAILDALAAFHGSEARSPFRLVEHSMMDEEYIGGCPVGTPAPGMWINLGPWLKKPFIKVHWAGTETSSVWNGYMEGAVCSGQRAADEILGLGE